MNSDFFYQETDGSWSVLGWMTGVSGFNRHELGQTSGDGEGQEGCVCCSLWYYKESDTTWRQNNSNTLLDLGTCSWPNFQAVALKTVLF